MNYIIMRKLISGLATLVAQGHITTEHAKYTVSFEAQRLDNKPFFEADCLRLLDEMLKE